MHYASVKNRFLISFSANLVKSGFSLIAGLFTARALGPVNYGNLGFLLGSFTAIFPLLTMGTQNAFYTFISRRSRGVNFYALYFLGIFIQFIILLILILLAIPNDVILKIWLGHDRVTIFISMLVVFVQQQIWQTVNQIAESMRKTLIIQFLSVAVSVLNIVIILTLIMFSKLSLWAVMISMIILPTLAAFIGLRLIGGIKIFKVDDDASFLEIFQEFLSYCKPLLILYVLIFIHNFSDKWLLQNFGGSIQQGFFLIANQFSTISLLATTSILNIFWKEIAVSWENHDLHRVKILYTKVNRLLIIFSAFCSGLLIPWSKEIITITLGIDFSGAWPTLSIMLLYPIYQTMGQIGGSMFFAKGETRLQMYFTLASTLLSLPLTYFMLAPQSSFGLDLGAIGIAIKMIMLSVFGANIQAWVISRLNGWSYDWLFQVLGIPLIIFCGFISKKIVNVIFIIDNINFTDLVFPVMLFALIYFSFIAFMISKLTWIFECDVNEIKNNLVSFFRKNNGRF